MDITRKTFIKLDMDIYFYGGNKISEMRKQFFHVIDNELNIYSVMHEIFFKY